MSSFGNLLERCVLHLRTHLCACKRYPSADAPRFFRTTRQNPGRGATHHARSRTGGHGNVRRTPPRPRSCGTPSTPATALSAWSCRRALVCPLNTEPRPLTAPLCPPPPPPSEEMGRGHEEVPIHHRVWRAVVASFRGEGIHVDDPAVMSVLAGATQSRDSGLETLGAGAHTHSCPGDTSATRRGPRTTCPRLP